MIRLGIAGIGIIARDYIGLICAGAVPDVQLTALSSRNTAHMDALKEQYPQLESLHCFTDYEEMLSSGVIDGVLISTPHGLHPSMTMQALERGIHVLVEKPVGIFCDEVARIAAWLQAHPEMVCGVLYNRRASPTFRWAKTEVERGALGELVRCSWTITDLYRTDAYYRSGSWRGTWQSEGGGLLMTQASHQLDLMQWICGMPSTVLARCSSIQRPIVTENEADLLFRYDNGAHGHFLASARECPGSNLLEVCGTRGRIRIWDDCEAELLSMDGDEREFAHSCPSPFEKLPFTQKRLSFDGRDNKFQQAATIENFARAVQGQELIQCSLEEGLKSLQIIHGAYLSHWKKAEQTLPVEEEEFRALLAKQDSDLTLSG